ncbi:ESCRT-I subunit protein SRN2 Ecym_4248 [Eremothecium cymbalariae DBVPG|uniref:VPS37 C-terminal domain-containing protein n=1 Tax=Eremothecium cymbalariae (strain CBS 270.75 / DBVPG 7215 / KCTC 17166 / NRRL Y-17582) TaxID=931890 RepID=G8JTG0_ERECY|nr:hypothetical protein Ecym_4248 [Eremothecium cymbalariae DBVPG\
MSTPELPPKPVTDKSETKQVQVDLPANSHLLSVEELKEIIQARDKLQAYVNRFCKNDEVKKQVGSYKTVLSNLKEDFRYLEDQKFELQDNLDAYHRLECQYREKLQLLDMAINDSYNDPTLKHKFKSQIRELDEKSRAMEARLDATDVDAFISEYISLRTNYHLYSEKLNTWDSQGALINDG